jgi:uncharacterized membrane protein YhhN
MQFKDLTKIHLVILLMHLATIYVDDNPLLRQASKLLLLTTLSLWWFHHSRWSSRPFALFGIGLLFSLIGDGLLLSPDWFIPGLLAFALAQILYSWCFALLIQKERVGKKTFVLPFLSSAAIFTLLLVPRLSAAADLAIPIAVYGVVILTMMAFAWTLSLYKPSVFLPLGIASSVFVTSDILLGIDKFLFAIPHGSLWIMLTYGVAQYGLVFTMQRLGN